jgi:hypothetical protein
LTGIPAWAKNVVSHQMIRSFVNQITEEPAQFVSVRNVPLERIERSCHKPNAGGTISIVEMPADPFVMEQPE